MSLVVPVSRTQVYRIHHNSDWSGDVSITYSELGAPGEDPSTVKHTQVIELPAEIFLTVAEVLVSHHAAPGTVIRCARCRNLLSRG